MIAPCRSAEKPAARGIRRIHHSDGAVPPDKQLHPDALLFFRAGDFYELLFDDAKLASRELGLTLTSRTRGDGAGAVRYPPATDIPQLACPLIDLRRVSDLQ